MIVSELVSQLKSMPPGAIVVTAEDPEGAWTLISGRAIQSEYESLDICILKMGV